MAIGAGTAILASGALSSAAQYLTNLQNIEANAQRFSDQTNLANTAHQREVMDLKAAGLNPILSASGSGSQVPSLAAYDMKSPGEGLSSAISDAAKVANLDVPLKESQIAVNSAQAENLHNQGVLYRAQAQAVNEGVNAAEKVKDVLPRVGEWVGDKVGSVVGQVFGDDGSSTRKPWEPKAIPIRQKSKPAPIKMSPRMRREMGLPSSSTTTTKPKGNARFYR